MFALALLYSEGGPISKGAFQDILDGPHIKKIDQIELKTCI